MYTSESLCYTPKASYYKSTILQDKIKVKIKEKTLRFPFKHQFRNQIVTPLTLYYHYDIC